MQILPFSETFIDEMARLFVEAYTEPGCEWDLPTASAYLARIYQPYPEFSLMALDESGEIMGAVFCSPVPYYKTTWLHVDSLQVKEQFRSQGVGKALLTAVLKKAKEQNFGGVHLLADERRSFPRGWYEKLGFEKTHWVEYEAPIEDITFDESR